MTINSPTSGKGWPCEPLFNHTVILTGLILCGFCIGSHSYHKFISAVAMSYPEDGISQYYLHSFLTLFSFPEICGGLLILSFYVVLGTHNHLLLAC